MDIRAVKIVVYGKVQGVFYRKTAAEKAELLGIVGWIKNNADGTVEIVAQGSGEQIGSLLNWCRQGPKNAEVTEVEYEDIPASQYSEFKVIR